VFSEEDIQRYLRDARGTSADAEVLRGITATEANLAQGPGKALESVWGPMPEEAKTVVKAFTDYMKDLTATGEAGMKYGINYGKYVKGTAEQPGRAATVLNRAAPRTYSTAIAINPYNTAIGKGA